MAITAAVDTAYQKMRQTSGELKALETKLQGKKKLQLVYAHFNLVVGVPIDADIQKCTNHLENAFGRLGIHIIGANNLLEQNPGYGGK